MYRVLLILALITVGMDAILVQRAAAQTFLKEPFTNPTEDRGLPRVLLIGDSISIGYTTRVRRLLHETASVYRPPTNCRWSAWGAEHLDEWLEPGDWDVIHFNFGLWDWYGWSQQVKATPASYANNLESIVTVLQRSKAKLIFAVTTPPCVGPEKKVRIVVSDESAEQFNQAAITVMQKHDVQINDLYSVIAGQRSRFQRGPDDVHYNDAGRDLLAAHVADAIRKALATPD